MTDVTDSAPMRRVRPWIAALLTFLGLGVGFFYAGDTRRAIRWAILQVLLSVALGAAFAAYVYFRRALPPGMSGRESEWSTIDTISIITTLLVAVLAWRVAARNTFVPKAGFARHSAYLAIWLLPMLISLILAMSVRFAFVQPYRIPSAAMEPTLRVGDYIVVSKGSYGYSRFSIAPLEGLAPAGRWRAQQPERGDLVVFRPPSDPERDFIKRLIAMPGDRVQMIEGVLHINGAPVPREDLGMVNFTDEYGVVDQVQAYRQTLPNGVSFTIHEIQGDDGDLDNTREVLVPAGHYFFMGDNRDNSDDSRRSVGFVPFDNLVGRVDYIFPRTHTISRDAY
jgi:signal peptidase I